MVVRTIVFHIEVDANLPLKVPLIDHFSLERVWVEISHEHQPRSILIMGMSRQ